MLMSLDQGHRARPAREKIQDNAGKSRPSSTILCKREYLLVFILER